MKGTAIDFGKEKISVLFRKLFMPTLLGMLSMSAVTTIDGIFIGHGVGSDGIAAVNICVPLLMFVMGVGLMVGAGCSVVSSIHLSKGKVSAARASVTQAMIFVTLFAFVAGGFILLFPRYTAYLLGSSTHLLPLVVDYLVWFTPSLLFELWIAVALFAIRLDGMPKFAMWCSMAAALANVVLDWLFIFPLGWGVMGAAFATSLSCLVGAVMVLVYLFFYARTLRLHPLRFRINGLRMFLRDMRMQCKIGSSALLGELTMAILLFVGNHVFMRYLGDDGVGAFGVSCYYLPFVFMIGNAIAHSSQPIISYNFGVGNTERVRQTLIVSLKMSFICGLISSVSFMLFPDTLVGLFLPLDTAAARIATDGFPYYGVGFVFFILNLSIIGYYQSMERMRPATMFAIFRGCLFLLPCFVFLPQAIGIKGIWLALPLSEILTAGVILINSLVHRYKTRI